MSVLTEPQAWREIARRIAEREWTAYGLCYEIWYMGFYGYISSTIQKQMKDRLDEYMSDPEAYAYHPGTEAEARTLAALWLACEAEEAAAGIRALDTFATGV